MSKSFRGLKCVFSVNSTLIAKYKALSGVVMFEVTNTGNTKYAVLCNVALCSQEDINILLLSSCMSSDSDTLFASIH
jgi:hypothetical protein